MRIEAGSLRGIATDIFRAAKLDEDKAATVARLLVEADLMGHRTHGLALLPWYIQGIGDGSIASEGEIEEISDRGPSICWNANNLPGAWVTEKGVALACERAQTYGVATLVVGNTHHIGCLAVYLEHATSRGLLISITCTSPSGKAVAPFGGMTPVFTPNPTAHGIPTAAEPVLIDISASITTINMAKQMAARGERYQHDWVLDRHGAPSREPQALLDGGSLLPTGGLDHGQKGYGMALQAEALTQGLFGYGRADGPVTGPTTSVTIEVRDPNAFGGVEAFLRQTGWLRDACLSSAPLPGGPAVRLPGQAAQARRRDALSNGLDLSPDILAGLRKTAADLGVSASQIQKIAEETP